MESCIEEVKQLKDWFFIQLKKKWTDVDCKCGLKVVTRDRIEMESWKEELKWLKRRLYYCQKNSELMSWYHCSRPGSVGEFKIDCGNL